MDCLIKSVAYNNNVRVYLVSIKELLDERLSLNKYSENGKELFGKVLSASLLLGGGLKNDQRLSIKIKGDGECELIVTEVDSLGNIKGYIANPNCLEGKPLDEEKALGNGQLTVTKDLNIKKLYTTSIPLNYPLIQDNFTYYFLKSEQVMTFVLLAKIGGVLIQLLPGYDPKIIDNLKEVIEEYYDIEKYLDKYPPKDILKLMFEDLDILDIVNVKYYCDCSKKKFANCLKTLPKEELEEIIKEDGKAEIVCNYCNKKYHFSKEELEDLIKK